MRLYNLLFICTEGINRSRTAAELYNKEYNTYYAGIQSRKKPITHESINNADIIFVMEQRHLDYLISNYSECLHKSVINLEIEDIYVYNQPELVRILKPKIQNYLMK